MLAVRFQTLYVIPEEPPKSPRTFTEVRNHIRKLRARARPKARENQKKPARKGKGYGS